MQALKRSSPKINFVGVVKLLTLQVLYLNYYMFANSINGWRLKQQTNGNAIMVDGQKPMLVNSIDKDRIT